MSSTATIQLLREWPPGFGGVERVAHELAVIHAVKHDPWQTYCLAGRLTDSGVDPLPVTYTRMRLPRLALGRLLLPLPSRRLLRILLAEYPMHVHLPCPALLGLAALARVIHPDRRITLHWHAFIASETGLKGCLMAVYQWLALHFARAAAQHVYTTSPILANALKQAGIAPSKLIVLPCCLAETQEEMANRVWRNKRQLLSSAQAGAYPYRLLFIGRLDSYKRVDWLIKAFQESRAGELHIVGAGPQREVLEAQARQIASSGAIRFHGRVSESQKYALLARTELLVLPSDRCNEAFGIVQLEAMACGVPALAFDCERSGMAWVGGLAKWLGRSSIKPADLPQILYQFGSDRALLQLAGEVARRRYEKLFARVVWCRRLEAIQL